MKTKILLLMLFTLHLSINAQTDFIYHRVSIEFDSGIQTGLFKITSADIDGDGDMDVIAAAGTLSVAKVTWYENTDGLGNFGPENLIFDPNENALSYRYTSLYTSDFDGDGDIDVFTTSWSSDVVSWFENLDGKGNFSTEKIISTNLVHGTSVITSDLDGDGDEDVVYSSRDTDFIFWHKNTDGNGTTGVQLTLASANGAESIIAKDIDGDGDNDIIAALTYGDQVVWYENMDGLGDFSTQKLITSEGYRFKSVFATDMDNDGDLDVISGGWGSRNGFPGLAWYENLDGKGNFGPQNVVNQTSDIFTVVASDMDLDGDMDIVSGLSFHWYENLDGKGAFSPLKPVSTEVFRAESICTADIDNDGVTDIISANPAKHRVSWHENVMVSNRINGIVLFDVNNDGCFINNIVVPNTKVTMKNGNLSISTFTNSEGTYNLLPPSEGNYTVHVDAPSSLVNANPEESSFNFIGNVTTEYANFCLDPVKVVNDVSMVLFNIGRVPVPGFEVKYQMFFRNNGTSVLNGIIVLQFNNSKLEFVSSTDPTSSQNDSSLSFDFSNLNPFEGRYIDIVFKVFEPPITIGGDLLIFTAKITPVEEDDNPIDNKGYFNSPVLNSFDPNDISVIEGEQIAIEQIDEFLHYIIRFQNVGTIEATNVRVDNILHPNLDWDSFQLENTSHTNRVEITNGNEVSFIFDDIFLADETSNEPESHGFIAYKIKPKENITIGEIMNNEASIFFDFNAAVETNTVTTQVTNTLSVDQNNSTHFSVFPVPATDLLQIASKTNISQILIYNYTGQLILSQNVNSRTNNKTMNISNIQSGLYFLEIKDGNGTRGMKKIIKN